MSWIIPEMTVQGVAYRCRQKEQVFWKYETPVGHASIVGVIRLRGRFGQRVRLELLEVLGLEQAVGNLLNEGGG